MKKIISLALVLVMAMVCLTACGEKLMAPDGTYSTESGSYKAVFSDYDEKANSGKLSVIFTFSEVETTVSGTFSVAVNDPDDNTFVIDFTPDGGTLMESFGGYRANDNTFVQLLDLPEINGANTSYYYVDPTAPVEE